MKTITKTVYTFSELSESAKEKARQWWRTASSDDNFFAEYVYDDAAAIADIIGIDLCQTRKQKQDGSPIYTPTIYYRGFSSQGDGACFEGTYKYKKGALKALKAYAPLDTELHSICKALQNVQSRYFYQLTARMQHRGHYYHSGCMAVTVDCADDRETSKGEDEITQCMRDFANWIYSQLEREYDYQNSDSVIDENIICNEYDFYENGEIA